jgi:hypothetical protein
MGIKQTMMTANRLNEELTALENRHGMSSAVFYERFNRGELGDSREFLLWASLYDMAAKAKTAKPVRA